MKRLISLFILLSMLLAGCASGSESSVSKPESDVSSQSEAENSAPADESVGDPETSEPEEIEPVIENQWDKTPRDIDFVGHSFWGEFEKLFLPEGTDSQAITLLATTKAELDEIMEVCTHCDSLSEFAAGLTEEYFEEKAIIISGVASGTASTVFEFENVRVDEKGITVTISEKTPELCIDMMGTLLMTVEVNKSDIGGCRTVRTEIEERVYPLSGKVGEYDTTPRDIAFTPYTFNYIIDGKHIGTVDGKPDFKLEIHSDIYFIFRHEFDECIKYGKDGDDVEKYFRKGNDYFKDKALLTVYTASDNGRSVFEISSVRADENGITVTVSHSLAEEAETDAVYSVLVAEVDVSLLAGCEVYNLVFEDKENTLASPYVFPGKAKEDKAPCDFTFVDKDTGKPISGVWIRNKDVCSDKDGKLSVSADRTFTYSACADGYKSERVTLIRKGGTFRVEMTPVYEDDVKIQITVVDKLTGEPLKGAVAGFLEFSNYLGEADGMADENGVVVLTISKEDFERKYSYFEIGVRHDGYLSFCTFVLDKGNQKLDYTVGLHKYKSELIS